MKIQDGRLVHRTNVGRLPRSSNTEMSCKSLPGSLLVRALQDLDTEGPFRRRRELLGTMVLLVQRVAFPPFAQSTPEIVGGGEAPLLVKYTSPTNNYTIYRPTPWERIEKAGADVLFRDKIQHGITLGVTVLPVMISSLEEFGSLDQVADKLVAAENAKDSTMAVAVVTKAQRSATSNNLAYDFVYELESTRGRKRIITTVMIVHGKLFIANGMVPCGREGCEIQAIETANVLEFATKSLNIEN